MCPGEFIHSVGKGFIHVCINNNFEANLCSALRACLIVFEEGLIKKLRDFYTKVSKELISIYL